MKINKLIEKLKKIEDEYGEELEVSFLLSDIDELEIEQVHVVCGRKDRYEVQLT